MHGEKLFVRSTVTGKNSIRLLVGLITLWGDLTMLEIIAIVDDREFVYVADDYVGSLYFVASGDWRFEDRFGHVPFGATTRDGVIDCILTA